MAYSCTTTLIVMATILGPVTLVFMAVSFGTDHWLEFRVDRAKLTFAPAVTNWQQNRYYTSRDRGIFRECYPDNNTAWLDYAEDVVDKYCFNIKYEQPSSMDDPSDDYMARLHLNRCFLAFFILSLVFFILGYVFGLVLCCMRISRWAYIAGILSYTSAFTLAASIAFFHGAEYIERNKLDNPAKEAEFYPNWPADLKSNTDRDYGYSYALGWVGMILAALTATLYSLAGCYLTGERYEDREILAKQGMRRGADYPMALEPVYALGADPYYSNKHYGYPQAYVGPAMPEYYQRAAYPAAIGYADPSKDYMQWREVDS